jgi:hypothetical protein
VGPRATLDAVEYRKSLAPAKDRTPVFQPVALPTELFQLTEMMYSPFLTQRMCVHACTSTQKDNEVTMWTFYSKLRFSNVVIRS